LRVTFGVLDQQALADLMCVPIEDEQCAELAFVGFAIRHKPRECVAQELLRRDRIVAWQGPAKFFLGRPAVQLRGWATFGRRRTRFHGQARHSAKDGFAALDISISRAKAPFCFICRHPRHLAALGTRFIATEADVRSTMRNSAPKSARQKLRDVRSCKMGVSETLSESAQ
jgi:hypothetical protein